MNISQYLLPEITNIHDERHTRQYAEYRANHYDIARMERDAAEATGISYYTIVSDHSGLPAEWRDALAAATAHNEALDAALPDRSVIPHRPIPLSEWEQRDGTAE